MTAHPAALPLPSPEPETNPYIFSDPATDRARLETQTALYTTWLRANARRLVSHPVTNILDLGCGEGQLGLVLQRVFRPAVLVGVDKDPQAIATARQRAATQDVPGTTYEVGDITTGLPAGRFDLIYASVILLHLPNPLTTLRHAYRALAPGGTLWIKELHPSIETALTHPAYLRLMGLMYQTLVTIGAHPYLVRDLPTLLPQIGFTDVCMETEEYPLGGSTLEGRATLGILLGAMYNARGMISKVQQLPESELLRLYGEIGEDARRSSTPVGTFVMADILARRPLTGRIRPALVEELH